MNELNARLAYVVGDRYASMAQLSNVMTASQFFKSVLDGNLPMNFTWMVGQGLNAVEENLLQLCKAYRSEIRFYGDEEMQMIKTSEAPLSKNFCAKFSQILSAITHRLGLSR